MRVPNWLYNYGRLLATALVMAGMAVAAFVSDLFKVAIFSVTLVVALVVLVEVVRVALRGGDAFDWWRK